MRCISPTKGWSDYQTQALWGRPGRKDVYLLVHDLGFGELVAASGATLPSVITFRLRNMHPDRVNSALQSVLSQHGEALEHGAMVSVTEGQVRVRRLPLST
jgi:predicted nuclease of predicted toxin-antitoxin system